MFRSRFGIVIIWLVVYSSDVSQGTKISNVIPSIPKTALVASDVTKLKTRFGRQGFKDLQHFHDGWLQAAALPKFNPTQNEAKWFNKMHERHNHVGHPGSSCTYGQRMEYRQLTRAQRLRFHRAIKSMKNTLIDGVSEYDIFVHYHRPQNSPAAHGGAAFFPWHREYIHRFENALREHDPCVSLPYWDSELDHLLPEAKDSIIWSNDYLGDQYGRVTEGPFRHWSVIKECQFKVGGRTLVRNVTGKPDTFLFSAQDIADLNSHHRYQDIVVPNTFEKEHGGPHDYVGGHMGNLSCSPSDPIFWMHHAFVDFLWEDFRQKHQTTDLEREYPEHSDKIKIGAPEHNPFAPMKPFRNMVNRQGLDDDYTRIHYYYAPRPIRCSRDWQCGPSLWCHGGRCMSKVKYGGVCNGFPAYSRSPCERGKCVYNHGNYRCLCRRKWHHHYHWRYC